MNFPLPFSSPLYLLGLLPWATAAIWLLLGRRQRVAVPFVLLWRGPTASPRAKPALSRPPIAILLAIVSLLLAVLASARPFLPSRYKAAVTLIVDRGITMSARGLNAERFKETAELLATHLHEAAGDVPVQLIILPAQSASSAPHDWIAAVQSMPPTNQPSQPALNAAVKQALSETFGSVIVITDQPITSDPRVIQIEPDRPVSNLTIENVAARAKPYPQVMVVLNDQNSATDYRPAQVRVESAENRTTQSVQIPRNGTATAFFDLPALGQTISINVDAPDDLSVDNHAWLAEEQQPPTIEDLPSLPQPLRRMIAVYRRHRAGDGQRVEFIANADDAPTDQPSIILAPNSAAPSSSPLHVEDHPIASNVDWAVDTADTTAAAAPSGYHVIVSKGTAAFVAVREKPARSVWVCMNSSSWPATPGFVIFWTNVFDWLGGDGEYRWHLADGHEPGIEKSTDGTTRAFNAINVDFPPLHPNDWMRLRSAAERTQIGLDLTPIACLLALLVMTLAIGASRLGFHFSQPRTVASIT